MLGGMATCKKCGASIAWVKSGTTGKRFPVDRTPLTFPEGAMLPGSLAIVLDGEAFVLPPFGRAQRYGYFRMHRRTCPAEAIRWACGGYSPAA